MLDPGDVRLSRSLFAQETPVVARALLGRDVVHRLPSGACLRGRIVETEAYHGQDDTASHARFGRTGRSALMFGPPGHAYVYLIYGMYEMLNVTANPEDFPGAVLIRALEPREGLERMRDFRVASRLGKAKAGAEGEAKAKGNANAKAMRDLDLCRGPARLCQALAIDRELNAVDVTASSAMWIERPTRGAVAPTTISTARIGIASAGPQWTPALLRWCVAGSRFVSG